MSGDKIPNPYKRKLLLEVPTKAGVKRAGKRYVKIWIFEDATSQKAVEDFIKARWPLIRIFLENKGRRTKGPKYPDLVNEIFMLNVQPLPTLRKWAKEKDFENKNLYRYDLIAKILHLKGKNPGERVKKILMRYKNKPRDT